MSATITVSVLIDNDASALGEASDQDMCDYGEFVARWLPGELALRMNNSAQLDVRVQVTPVVSTMVGVTGGDDAQCDMIERAALDIIDRDSFRAWRAEIETA